MTVFGQTLGGQELFALASLLTLLVFWLFVLPREHAYGRWFKRWEAERRARRLGQEEEPTSPTGKPRGPWG
ncbi:hypothetical protein [uncultured Brevundimonas sp.]|uniref:hypothetical protein n=1 Tax=uncultured Brevundimonas sp. TaxID=213418 RepID=UPI0030EF7B45|tara:strand:- start:2829 stop:3041 length:213 start_codon:yes stop_codon:yes gene_type:complete